MLQVVRDILDTPGVTDCLIYLELSGYESQTIIEVSNFKYYAQTYNCVRNINIRLMKMTLDMSLVQPRVI